MTREYLLTVKYLLFANSKLDDTRTDIFDDEGEAIGAYEACVMSPLTLEARLIEVERGQFLRRYIKKPERVA